MKNFKVKVFRSRCVNHAWRFLSVFSPFFGRFSFPQGPLINLKNSFRLLNANQHFVAVNYVTEIQFAEF
jgi:hypothetical protein